MRSFVAVEVPDQFGPAIESIRAAASGAVGKIRWVRTDGAHLTLAFLGKVGADRLPGLVRRLGEAARGQAPFPLGFDGVGVFPHPRRATVLWLGIRDLTGGLALLQRAVEAGLALEGFPPEGRLFFPHVTLGRWREPLTAARVEALLQTPLPAVEGTWTVRALRLMESRLTREGSVYSVVEDLPFGEEATRVVTECEEHGKRGATP